MGAANVRASNNIRITTYALIYVVKYLRYRCNLSDYQISNLSSEDLNRIPEMIFADRGERVLLLGWIPIFGWVFAGKYLLFKSRVKYLRSLNETIFDKSNIQKAIYLSHKRDFNLFLTPEV